MITVNFSKMSVTKLFRHACVLVCLNISSIPYLQTVKTNIHTERPGFTSSRHLFSQFNVVGMLLGDWYVLAFAGPDLPEIKYVKFQSEIYLLTEKL